MNTREPIQAEEDEISLIDILLFLKASFGNIVISSLVCLLAGGSYYFSQPKMYEATATIEMARVANELIETPVVLVEKIKLLQYFSQVTFQACGLVDDPITRAKFVDMIKPSINKSVPMVSFAIKAPSSQVAKACLTAVIAEISSNQYAIAKPLLEQKKQKIQQLRDHLKLSEEISKSLSSFCVNGASIDAQLNCNINQVLIGRLNRSDINDLRIKVTDLEFELVEPSTYPTFLASQAFSTNPSVDKGPLSILGLCLAMGVFLGLLATLMMRQAPKIWRQMRQPS